MLQSYLIIYESEFSILQSELMIYKSKLIVL